MRVGFFTYALDRAVTGIGRYTYELGRALAAAENKPELILLTAGGAGPLAETALRQVRLAGCKLVPAIMTLGNVVIPLNARRLGLDLIHDCSGFTVNFLGTGGARYIVTIHDVIPWSFPGVSTKLDTLIYRRWLPSRLPHADAIITISEATKADLVNYMKIAPEKIHVTPLGVRPVYHPSAKDDIERVRRELNLPPHYILFVGNVEARKNLVRVLQAFARLREKGIAEKMVVVGPQKWKYAHIMQALTDLKIEEDVLFTGYINEADLPIIYSAADVFVFPSLYEGFGLPPLEAMACGAPVLTSNVSSLPEVVGDAAVKVDPYDVEAITDGLTRLLTDTAFHQTMHERGLAHAVQFTWQRTASATLTIYHHVFGG